MARILKIFLAEFVLMHEKKEGPNGTVIYYGIFFDFLNTLAKHLNFEYTVKEPEDQTWGAIDENGEWSGMIGQIIRKEVDFGSGGFTITKSRSEVVDFMVPWWEGSVTFMVKLPGDEAFSLYLRPFKYETWLVVACTVLVVGLTLIFLHKMSRYSTIYNKSKRMKYKSILETKGKLADARANPHMLHTYGYMLNQGCRQKSTKPSSRIFISCYWILTITITATYSGNLVAFMTVKKMKVPINSLRELVENPDYQAGVAFRGSTHGLFKEAKSGIYKEVWDKSINVNPNNFYIRGNRYKETLPALKRVQEEKFVYISDSIHSFGVISKSGVCDVTLAKERFYKVGYGLPAQKGFPYLQMFNKGILAIQEAGLFKKWQQIHWRFGENQCDNSLSSVGHSPTNLLNTVGMYFALATGIGVAFVVLLTEILVKYVRTHRIKTLSSLGLYEKFGFGSLQQDLCRR